ncbi:MAG: polynucleotide adenylyltransferase PcnB [Burkholderiaceae bacterium]
MIRQFIGRILGRGPASQNASRQATVYKGSELGIDPGQISRAAQQTCDGLHQAGFKAFIVGGGVRDLLANLKPKDFDVATDATPDEVVKLFRRARIIGRRFRIVHVIFGREVIEVTTFRGAQENAETDDHGRVLRDNVWGDHVQDAMRRDFTVNALYYDPIADQVVDYHDGVRDMRKKKLRMIGDPETRYREDPVRMLRVVRFAAKLGFDIEANTKKPLTELAPLISNVPQARLFEEILKLLLSGSSIACLHELRAAGLHQGLLPLLDVILEQPDGERFVTEALKRTDERIAAGKGVSPGFLFGTLLWQQVNERWQQAQTAGEHRIPALMAAIDSVLDEQAKKLAIQKRFTSDMREIWSLQPRFERRNGQAPFRLFEHMRFRAAYDFLLLRCDTGEVPAELGKWWTDFQECTAEQRRDMVANAPTSGPKRRNRSRRSRNSNSASSRTSGNGAPAADTSTG